MSDDAGVHDLSDGKLSTSSTEDANLSLDIRRDKRRMRLLAFSSLGLVCLAYLVLLLIFLYKFFLCPPDFIKNPGTSTHVYVLIGLAIIIMAAVPLSIALSLVKMTADTNYSKDDEAVLTTPNLEIIKVIIDNCKSLFTKS